MSERFTGFSSKEAEIKCAFSLSTIERNTYHLHMLQTISHGGSCSCGSRSCRAATRVTISLLFLLPFFFFSLSSPFSSDCTYFPPLVLQIDPCFTATPYMRRWFTTARVSTQAYPDKQSTLCTVHAPFCAEQTELPFLYVLLHIYGTAVGDCVQTVM